MKSEATSGAGSLKYSFDNITYTDFIPTATPFMILCGTEHGLQLMLM
ncbi:MAG: hypothetical protein QM205_02150 [Bacillota bacterium]|nr:hypothetical protein [Bacillota bacterium]